MKHEASPSNPLHPQDAPRSDKSRKLGTSAPVLLAACGSLMALSGCDANGNMHPGAMILTGVASELSGNSVNWDPVVDYSARYDRQGSQASGGASGFGCGCDSSNCGPGPGSIQ